MNIIRIMQQYHAANEADKRSIEKQVNTMFQLLPEKEKREVQKMFLNSLDKKINQAGALIEEANFKMELAYV